MFARCLPRLLCVALVVVAQCASQRIPTPSKPDAYKMTLSASHVTPGVSRDFTMTCSRDKSVPSPIEDFKWLQISKKEGNTYRVVALMSLEDGVLDIQTRVKGIQVETKIEPEPEMKIIFPLAEMDMAGFYHCEAVGKDKHSSTFIHKTADIEVKEQDVEQKEILGMLLELKKEAITRQSLDVWPEGRFALLKPDTGCPVDLAFYNGDQSSIDIRAKLTKLDNEKDSDNTDNRDENSQKSSNDDGDDSHSHQGQKNKSHLSLPITGSSTGINDITHLRFCEVSRPVPTPLSPMRAAWPKGNYCILKITGSKCPAGFEVGSLTLDKFFERSTEKIRYEGNVFFEEKSDIVFCCKKSEEDVKVKDTKDFTSDNKDEKDLSVNVISKDVKKDTEKVLELPTTYPFYLFPKKGYKCPKVKNMRLTEESMVLQSPRSQAQLAGQVPDIILGSEESRQLNVRADSSRRDAMLVDERDIKLHLCYYRLEKNQ